MAACVHVRVQARVRRAAAAALAAASLLAWLPRAHAGPGDAEAKKGLSAAKRGRLRRRGAIPGGGGAGAPPPVDGGCSGAVLRRARRPLASRRALPRGCRREAGPNVDQSRTRRRGASRPTRRVRSTSASPPCASASRRATRKWRSRIDGRALESIDTPKQVAPDVQVSIVVRASGRKEHQEKVVLAEGERKLICGSAGASGAR